MKVFRILIVFFLSQHILYSQIAAPKLICVKRDTLIWDLPNVTCGTINGYSIFAARNPNGPYQMITTVTNPTQTKFFFNNTEGGAWYFYVETNATCAGQSRRQSDTLDNQLPSVTSVTTLNVIDAKTVEVRWRRSPNPKVTGYIVYKKTIIGLVTIADVPNRDTLRFLDKNATPNIKSEEYQVRAVDACENTSLYDVNHRTLLMRTTQDKCAQTITLRWNFYQNWSNPIAKHEVWVGLEGRTPSLLISLGAKDSTYVFKNAKNNTRYRFFVRAVESVSNISAQSNDTTLVANIIEPVKELTLKSVSIVNSRKIEIAWRWNKNAKVDSIFVLRRRIDSAWVTIYKGKPSYPLDDDFFFNDSSARADLYQYVYMVRTVDDCKGSLTSNIMTSFRMFAQPQSIGKNRLKWDSLIIEGGKVMGYQPIRIERGASTNIGTPIDPLSPKEFTDIITAKDPQICYRMAANYTYKLPDGTEEEATAYSNIVCTSQFTNIFMPNAFTPNGRNPLFKPIFTFSENITDYVFFILDRWGSVVFQTTDPTVGWDGTRNGADLPQGSYLYIIRLKQLSGGLVEEKGAMMLLR
jgi:gliding motility-associated-like protein